MKKIIGMLLLSMGVLTFTSCDTDIESESVQNLKTYDEQYYANIRTYKESDHTICFGWYAAYAPVEGVEGYKEPASWGERIIGIPDSIDIVSLWMGIPSNDPNNEDYSPIAYADMQYVKKNLGTKFIAPTIVRMNHKITLKDGTEYDLAANHTQEGIETFGQYLVDQVLDSGIDGVDLDYEPEGDWMQGDNFVELVKYIGQFFGPKGQYPDKLFCVDFYGQVPPAETEEYVNYFIRQSYGAGSAATLQSQYEAVNYTNPSKFIVTETFGEYAATGGVPFTEANGNTKSIYGGDLYSLEGMARWNPTQGRKAGFGAFYFGRDYYSNSAKPYIHMRQAIQAANPAVQ